MKMRIAPFIIAGLLVVAGGAIRPAEAQVGDVTFTVPLNLTQMSPDITKVAVWCKITGPAITTRSGNIGAQVELVPQGGQIVTTATVVVAWPPTDLTIPVARRPVTVAHSRDSATHSSAGMSFAKTIPRQPFG